MKKNNKIIYIAILGAGTYDDYAEQVIFCSFNKLKVKNWVNRFNRIIENNRDRIESYSVLNGKEPFWYEYIKWEMPRALLQEAPIR